MFHPSRACSTRPFQVFSFSCSRNHSATPCFIRRTRTVVALTPSMTAGSSVANSGIPDRDSFFSSFSALKVSRPDRSMSSQTTAANFGAGDGGLGEQVGHPAVAGDVPGHGAPGLAAAAGLQVQAAGLDVPVPGGDEPARAAARPGRRGSAGSARRGGLASPGWRCGPGTRPGPARPARPPGGWPRRRRASGAWFVLALPLEYLHDHFRLPRVNQLRAFPGGDADLEPDLDPARPFPLRYIIADHTPIRCYSRQITMIIFPAFPSIFFCHFPFSSRAA